jgi:hypothetical protein
MRLELHKIKGRHVAGIRHKFVLLKRIFKKKRERESVNFM